MDTCLNYELATLTPLRLPRKIYPSSLTTKESKDELMDTVDAINNGFDLGEPPSLLTEYLQVLLDLFQGLDVNNAALVTASVDKLALMTKTVLDNSQKFHG
jgi:hypothetical protein